MAREEPGAIVLVEPDGTEWSAADMLGRSRRLGRFFRESGVAPGQCVLAMLEDSALVLQLYLACLESGLYFVPLSPASSPGETAYVIDECRPALVVSAANGAEVVKRACSMPDEPPPERTSGAPLFYTSGSTGRPKAVLKPLSGASPERLGKFAAVHLNAVCGIRPQSGLVHLVASPLYHSASLLWCTDHLHLGHRVVLAGSWDSERLLHLIEGYEVTGSLMVPTHFYRLLSLPEDVRRKHDVSSLRHVVHTGAPCAVEVKHKMLDWWGDVIYEVYGAAEGGGTRVTPAEWREKPGTVGRSFGRIRILNQDGQECGQGEIGTVYLKPGSTAFVYRNDERKTQEAWLDGYFTVGDRGYLDSDDYLFLVGRTDSMILTGGVNVSPAEVERALLSHPSVADALVVGVPDEEYGSKVKAVVQPSPGQLPEQLENALKQHCESALGPARRPRLYQFVDSLPRNRAGKISQRDLLAFCGGESTETEERPSSEI